MTSNAAWGHLPKIFHGQPGGTGPILSTAASLLTKVYTIHYVRRSQYPAKIILTCSASREVVGRKARLAGNGLVLDKRRNTANDRFPARPKGAKQMTQYGVTALNKDLPLSADCVLSWIICLALNMSILPWKDTNIEQNGLPSQRSGKRLQAQISVMVAFTPAQDSKGPAVRASAQSDGCFDLIPDTVRQGCLG